MNDETRAYLSQIGSKGGKVKSEAKLRAVRENVKKATAARMNKKPL